MKVNLPVTGNQVVLRDNQSIISMTDLKGKITYVNNDFVEISGYAEEELLDRSHNIVRHPDMPPAAFQHLWDTLKQGSPWRGTVKNRCKNGDYYWVDAFVTPVIKQGEVCGYQSVRSKPSEQQIRQAQALYDQINQKKLQALPRQRDFRMRASTEFKLIQGIWLLLVGLTLLLGDLPTPARYGLGGAALLLSAGCWWWVNRRLIRPLREMASHTKAIANGDLDKVIALDRIGALGEMQTSLKMIQARLKAVIGRIQESSFSLASATDQFAAMSRQNDQSMQSQMLETDQVATAVQQMSATVQEVAGSCNAAAEAAHDADQCVSQGDLEVQETQTRIRNLAGEVEAAEAVIQGLHQDTSNIGSILDVISAVAEQTNLLALNAAIEAARAGEQGRGFAVVADEVRSLAQRSQSSASEIHRMIETLQQKADSAVEVMQRGRDCADSSVAQAQRAGEALGQIHQAVNRIQDMSTQIAAATEQQSAVTLEIRQNIERIRALSMETAAATSEAARGASDLRVTTGKLTRAVEDYDI